MPTSPFLNPADSAPAHDFYAVTPSDSADLPNGRCRSIFVGVNGNVAVYNAAGNSITFVGVGPGVLPVRTNRILATGTTATSIVALY